MLVMHIWTIMLRLCQGGMTDSTVSISSFHQGCNRDVLSLSIVIFSCTGNGSGWVRGYSFPKDPPLTLNQYYRHHYLEMQVGQVSVLSKWIPMRMIYQRSYFADRSAQTYMGELKTIIRAEMATSAVVEGQTTTQPLHILTRLIGHIEISKAVQFVA